MADSTPLPAGGRSREAIAMIEVGQTNIRRSTAVALVSFFLAAIVAAPVHERFSHDAAHGASAWRTLSATPRAMAAAAAAARTRGDTAWWQQVFAANRAALAGISRFEQALDDRSAIGRALRPRAQAILSGWLGAGNERVYLGREGWLFYRPDLDYVTGRGFLEPEALRRRTAAADAWAAPPHPDPRPAIARFHRQLAARGIVLIVVPTPVKPGIHPEKFAAEQTAGPIQNASYADFLAWLQSEGIRVFDPAIVLDSVRGSGPQYLLTDTHWRPEAMELVAERLAAFVRQQTDLPAAPSARRVESLEIATTGDTAAMLDLPAHQRLYPPERAVISRVLGEDGSPWRSDRAADVLLLGDSFTNIYSLASMGWGDSAGLAEHLSYALGRPLDRIVQNDAGAFATREMLRQAGPERLDGKRVVIWQFAARELATGDWKEIN
jgi:alginate O-acetyltransferase complex protein AlgJ